MWAMAAASQFEKRLRNENKKLKEENEILKTELEFYKNISKFPNSLVGNMYVKYINGTKTWEDRQNISQDNKFHKLENDEIQWTEDIDIKFKDNDK